MHDTLLMVFAGILAVMVVLQTIVFFGIYQAIRHMSAAVDRMGKDLLGHIQVVSGKVDEGVRAIKGISEGFKPIRDKLEDTTDIIRNRVSELDGFIAEIANTARLEVLRIQDIVQSVSEKVEETLELLRKGILAPLNEINAISRAVRIAMDVLFRRQKKPGSVQDEEMFI
jgi:methyl-accepting chemotaxis protein